MKIHLYRPNGDASPFNPIHFPLPDGEGDDSGGGGEKDDDSGDTDDGDDDGEEEDDADADGKQGKDKDDKTPTKADLDKALRSARRARQEAAKWRRIAQGKSGGSGDGETDGDGGGQKGPDFRTVAATTTAYNALRDAGFSGDQRKAMRILRDVDLTTIEPDSKGFFDPEDFADVVDEIKDDWPELFETKAKSRPRGSSHNYDEDQDEDERPVRRRVASNASARGSGPGKKLTPDQKFAAAVLGQAGFDDRARTVRRTGR